MGFWQNPVTAAEMACRPHKRSALTQLSPDEAAQAKAERDAITRIAAAADLRGHLQITEFDNMTAAAVAVTILRSLKPGEPWPAGVALYDAVDATVNVGDWSPAKDAARAGAFKTASVVASEHMGLSHDMVEAVTAEAMAWLMPRLAGDPLNTRAKLAMWQDHGLISVHERMPSIVGSSSHLVLNAGWIAEGDSARLPGGALSDAAGNALPRPIHLLTTPTRR